MLNKSGNVELAIIVSDSGRILQHEPEATLLETLLFQDEEISADCGGNGICGTCAVRFVSRPTEITETDRELLESSVLEEGWRLACHCYPQEDSVIEIDRSEDIHAMRIEADGLSKTDISFQHGQREAIQDASQHYGLAIDLGTTTIVCYLVDLTGEQADLISAFPNPQRVAGADVVSRIAYAHEGVEKLEKLQSLVTTQINRRLSHVLAEEGIAQSSVSKVVVVGNMTMTHLFRGCDPWALGVAPYQPEQLIWEEKSAEDLGLQALQQAVTHTFPGIAGHLGGDTIAGLLALNLRESKETSLLLDLGTNGEIVLVHEGRAYGSTCAAGPAFEGVRISCGMPAVPGAINDVVFDGADLKVTTIANASPIGLCGSGVADAIVALLEAGLIESSGRVKTSDQLTENVAPALQARLMKRERVRQVVLAPGVGQHATAMTQGDIREVQLAKAAFRSGIETLCARVGVQPSAIDHVYVAGGFGNALKPKTLTALGILPPILEERVILAGNVAGAGARAALLMDDAVRKANDIAEWVEHMPLESAPDFAATFTENLAFPM